VDIDKAARILASHRSPKQSALWAAQNLPQRSPSPPLFQPSEDNPPEESPKRRIPGSAAFKRMMAQRSQHQRRPLPQSRETPIPTIKKKSLFDEQPDARQVYFDSREPSPIPQSAQPPPHRQKTPEAPPRKRAKAQPPSHHDVDDNDDFERYNPPQNQELKSRELASTRRPPPQPESPPTARSITDAILNRIHGVAPSPPPANRELVRKGRGFEWTPEQELFFITQIETYGPAWADIASHHCRRGGMLEGRDQVKLKDKARNIKEKYIRYPPGCRLRHASGVFGLGRS
jgi:hypothetical protein